MYFFKILEGYKYQLENHIIDSKECFESAIRLNRAFRMSFFELSNFFDELFDQIEGVL